MKKLLSLKALAASLLLAPLLSSCAVITGKEHANEYTNDMRITTDVKTAIMQDPHLKLFEIHVETMKAEVQLSGFVSTKEQREEAGRLARAVDGVVGVKNSLIVR